MITFLVALLSIPGYPGPESTANYSIDVLLSPDSSTIEGTAEIFFTSGVEFPVDTLWLHLYPNAYRDHTTAFGQDLEAQGRFRFRRSEESDRGFIDLNGWTMNEEPEDIVIQVEGTLGYIVLDQPLAAGESVVLSGNFLVKVPKFWSRMGHSGETYQITQWYPKMCVLDEEGWHRSRYHDAGEFFSDYGNYSVSIDVPVDFITAATGRVLETDFNADSTRRVDHWTAENVHDFAWCASPDYTIRDHVFTYPDSGGTVRVHLVLLDDDEDYWKDIPAAVDSTLVYYGEWYMPYPYNDLWVVDPVVAASGGMEYPQFVFAAEALPMTRILEMVTIHEVGHQWFYGLLGNNEADEAWLDEGMNTFSELRYMERRHGFSGNMTTTPDWLLSISDGDLQALSYASEVHNDITPVLSRATDAGDGSYSTGYTYYTKPALFMSLIQVQLGDELFNEIMSAYFQRFAHCHPHTEDFQAIVEEFSNRSWQMEFDYWLRGTGSADVRISDLSISEDSTTVILGGPIPHGMLVPVMFICDSDTLEMLIQALPGEETVVTIAGEWHTAIADPFMRLPDSAPWNNTVPLNFKLKPLLLPVPQPGHYSVWALPFPGFADHSWRANAIFMLTPLPVETGGPFTFISHISIPFKENSSSACGFSLAVPIMRSYGEEVLLRTRLFSGYGINRMGARFSWETKGPLAVDPRHTVTFGAEMLSVSDTSVYGGDNVQTGSSMEIQAGVKVSQLFFNRSITAEVESFFSPGQSNDTYAGLSIEAETVHLLSGDFVASTRACVEGVTGNTPVQRMVRPGGGLFPENSIVEAVLSPEGVLGAQNHYFVRKGPALPGYWNSILRGKIGFSFEQSVRLEDIPIGVFAGTGWIGNSFNDLLNSSLISNAGIVLKAAIVEAFFPIWISHPSQSEGNWEFRWRLRISF